MANRAPDQIAGIVAVAPSAPELWYRVSGPARASSRTNDHTIAQESPQLVAGAVMKMIAELRAGE